MRRGIAIALLVGACHGSSSHEVATSTTDKSPVAPARPPTAPPPTATPEPTVAKIAVGSDFACALLDDHSMRCWGANASGQLGIGTQERSERPVAPKDLGEVTDFVLDSRGVCALRHDGTVACWGRITTPSEAGSVPVLVPTAVPGVEHAIRVFDAESPCAGLADGTLKCWGNLAADGSLAYGAGSHAATTIPGLKDVRTMIPGAALLGDGTVWYWYDDGVPHASTLVGATRIVSTKSLHDDARPGTDAKSKYEFVCAIVKDGAVQCIGGNVFCRLGIEHDREWSPEPVTVRQLGPARELAIIFAHLCAITASGNASCLADLLEQDSPGCGKLWPSIAIEHAVQLGNWAARSADGGVTWFRDEAAPKFHLEPVAGIASAIDVEADYQFGCALLADHHVWCWGRNDDGELGRGDAEPHEDAGPIELVERAGTSAPIVATTGGSHVDVKAHDDTSLLAQTLVEKIHNAYIPGIRRFTRKTLPDPHARVHLTLDLRVNETGRATHIHVRTSSHPEINGCVADASAMWVASVPKDKDGESTDAAFTITLEVSRPR